MLLTVIWVFEASIGLVGALLVLGDTLVIYGGLKKADKDVAHNYRVDILRDLLILSGQAINVVIGLIAALAAQHAQDGFASFLQVVSIIGLMSIPALMGIISFSTYRARRH